MIGRKWIKDKLSTLQASDFYYLVSIALVCSFCLPQKLTNIALVALIIITLYILKRQGLSGNVTYALLSALFFVALVAVSLGSLSNVQAILKANEKFLAFIFMPVLFIARDVLPEKKARSVLFIYSLFITLLCLFCFCIGLYNFLFKIPTLETANEDTVNAIVSSWNFLTYQRFSDPIEIHPAYFSLYISFSLLLLLENDKLLSPLISTSAVIQFASLLLLSSRISILAFIVAFMLWLIMKVIRAKISLKRFLLMLCTTVLIFGVLYASNNVFRKRLSDFSSINVNKKSSRWNSIELRAAIWICNWEAVRERPWLGYGYNEERRNECYKRYTFYPAYGTDFNAHNQYLEYLYFGGIVLIGLFMALVAFLMKMGIRERSNLLIFFLLLFLINIAAESYLNRVKGVFFFTYFASFLLHYTTMKKTTK